MIQEPDYGAVDGPKRLEEAQKLAEILRMQNLFSVGGVGVTPRFDVQGGMKMGSDRVEAGGDVNWRGMGVDVRPSVGVNIPGLGDLNAQFGAGWNGFRADLPKSIQNLGAPEHVQGGTRGPRLNSLGAGFTPENSPNSYSLDWQRSGRGENRPADKRAMFHFSRRF